MTAKCIMCGGKIEEAKAVDPFDDEDDGKKRNSLVFCQRCQAKIKYESNESQKIPKPM